MPWSNPQKAMAATACKAVGLSDEHRRLILRNLPNALYDAQGQPSPEPSSRSRRLNNADFEQFMSIIERQAGGRLQFARYDWPAGHWQGKADDSLHRMRSLAERLFAALDAADLLGRPGLATWIEKRVSGGRTDRLADLMYEELHKLINGLRAYGRRHGVALK